MNKYTKRNGIMLRYFKCTAALLLVTVYFLVNCKEKGNPLNNNSGGSTAVINIISGNNQTGNGGEILENPVILQVVDMRNEPVKEMRLYLNIVEGNGRIIDGSSIYTDNDGRAELQWEISSSYNAIKVFIFDDYYQAEPVFVYAQGENPVEMSITRTINSLEKLGDNLYSMTFYGDYTGILDGVNQRFTGHIRSNAYRIMERNFYCSIFTIFGNPEGYLFGRSFDNPEGWRCLTLVGKFNPPDGYRSIAFSRMRDYGFPLGTVIEELGYNDRISLLEAAFFVPDGINEHGVVIALANCPPVPFYPEAGKKAIFITYFVREVLDHARNLEEAIAISDNYNIICGDGEYADVHMLIGDASGRSAILEYYNGEFRVISNTENFQVATNSTIYNKSIFEQKNLSVRFNYIYNILEAAGGNVSRSEAMDILSSVSFLSTEWSAVYDMTNKEVIIAIDANFDNIYEFDFNW